jgi:predicted transcriptional regulator
MALHLTPALEERLQQLAAQSGATADQLTANVLDAYLTHVEELAAAVREGEESAERDGWLTHEEVFDHLNKRLLKTA